MPANRFTIILAVAAAPAAALAQRPQPFQIADNSLLVEEAFNQEAGIFQNIFLFQRARPGGDWLAEFTQEWPFFSQRHQVSYTVPFQLEAAEFGNVLVNYRLQARMEDESGPAFSPRLSLILPTGADNAYSWGLQLNLPVSRQVGDFYVHGNAGLTYDRLSQDVAGASSENMSLMAPHAAGSVIWRALPMVHLLVESTVHSEEFIGGGPCCDRERSTTWIVSPGFRAGRNLGSHQVVLGAGIPLGITGERATSLLLYFSYELPYRSLRSRAR